MDSAPTTQAPDPRELADWREALDAVLARGGVDRAQPLLAAVAEYARRRGIVLGGGATPYRNTIPAAADAPYPGEIELERRLRAWIRWNAMAMVVRANRARDGIGGHIATYASAATLFEVGFHHAFRAKVDEGPGDLVFFQGHASPGIYARAFLEGRIGIDLLERFRAEADGPGLASYPHPHTMPGFWQFPTVSMGLGPLQAVYQARWLKHLERRGRIAPSDRRVWCFVGDGETDEPETLAGLSLAAREDLDNLIFVVNCNLQRLDGPVRGNGKIIQELEGVFAGVGWNVLKVVWGRDWDPLLAADEHGLLQARMDEVPDGQYQTYAASPGAYTREHFFGVDPRLAALVADRDDAALVRLRRGGHDAIKVWTAYKAAMEHRGGPTVILAKTVKGWGLGDAGEAKNSAHQAKKVDREGLARFRARFSLDLPDAVLDAAGFWRPAADAPEMVYLRERRAALGGPLPSRSVQVPVVDDLATEIWSEFHEGSGERSVSTTMVLVRMLARAMREPGLGAEIVPIVPDEARTFGLEALFRQYGIYNGRGQRYEPVDRENLLWYREAVDGRIFEEGLTEAGSLAAFIAAGTSWSTLGVPGVPVFMFYSMFGFQRVGDLIWAASDAGARGILVGATAGRTTLQGEGLQHNDGHSQLLAQTVPGLRAWDPAYACELAVILEHALGEMARGQTPRLHYITAYNESWSMPALPADPAAREGILRGLWRVMAAPEDAPPRVALVASGCMVPEAEKARTLLAERYGIGAELWSATSWKALRDEARAVRRWNRLHPAEPPRRGWLESQLAEAPELVVAVSDWMQALPDLLSPWLPGRLEVLGTDGFGVSDDRGPLRRRFEVDAEHIAAATLSGLARRGGFEPAAAAAAIRDLGLDPDAPDPADS
jgi:pyruvate dehydrogenase E1 component